MGLMDSIFGSSSSIESRSVLDKSQKELLRFLAPLLQGGLESGATESQYAAYAETPERLSEAFALGGSLTGTGSDVMTRALMAQAGGQAAYTPDYGRVVDQFNETYAQPLMASWRENVLPVVKESFNVPGLAGSSITGKGVANAANSFYGQSVAPQLFTSLQNEWKAGVTSLENAAARQLEGATALGQLPLIASSGALQLGQLELTNEQRILSALRGEESRLFAENNPWLSPAANLATAQTVENVGMQGDSGIFGDLVGGALGASYLGSQGASLTGGLSAFFS